MYFDKFKSEKEIKERFRMLAQKLHPDHGGDEAIMKEILIEYNQALESLKHGFDRTPNYSPSFRTQQYEKKHRKEFVQETENQLKIEKVLEWAKTHADFDTDFIESLKERINEGQNLSLGQVKALNNIILKFRIKI